VTDAALVRDRFILHWGEMGPRWGINRTLAQVHALLYITEEPLDAAQIMEALAISRGNVSMAVNELIDWGIVRRVHVLGQRRELYTADQDVWVMLRRVLAERKRREVDPTIDVLREAVDTLDASTDGRAAYTRRRIADLLELFELGSKAFESLETRSPAALLSLARQVMRAKS
jgi:DNA-binding transcriptional regulator GbsR (MarR family)